MIVNLDLAFRYWCGKWGDWGLLNILGVWEGVTALGVKKPDLITPPDIESNGPPNPLIEKSYIS